MSYHECPIEPDDWTNGTPYEEGEECHQCEGTGEVTDDNDIEKTCTACDGTGFGQVDCADEDYGAYE